MFPTFWRLGGEDPKKVEAVIKDDPEVLALWRAEMVGEKHKHKPKVDGDADNISIKPGAGTSRAYTLDRLKRQSPELFREVRDGSNDNVITKTGEQGKRNDLRDNVTEVQPVDDRGNSKTYTLDRLKRESPDLFREVCDGRLSANGS